MSEEHPPKSPFKGGTFKRPFDVWISIKVVSSQRHVSFHMYRFSDMFLLNGTFLNDVE